MLVCYTNIIAFYESIKHIKKECVYHIKKIIDASKDFIPERIRFLREDANMTYKELSEKSGVSIRHKKKYETSDFGKLPAVELAFICEVFSISLDILYTPMDFEEFKENYQHLKQFCKLPKEMQDAFLEAMHEVPLDKHTDEEFIEFLFRKLSNGDDEFYKKHMDDFKKNYYAH